MASASSLLSQDENEYLKRLLECSICLETFDDPRTLSCLHSFCKKCLENFVDGKSKDELNCPVCRTKFTLKKDGVSGMTRNHFICNMVEVLSVQNQDKCIPCAHCEQPSVGRCVTCEEFMCGKCFKPHNEFPGFRDHDVLTMKELSKPENRSKIKGVSKCSRHPKKKLKYYCETCDELICRHCMDFTHNKQHQFSPVEEAARRKRQDLKEYCEFMESTIARSNKKTQVFKKDLESLTNNYEKAQRLLNEKREQLIAKVNEKTNSMRDIVHQNFDRKTKCIEDEKTKTQTFMNRTKASVDMSRSVLRDGNDEEIVRLYKSVQENVDSAKEKDDKKTNNDDDDVVLPWNSNEIDKMLFEEVQKHFKGEDRLVVQAPKMVMSGAKWRESRQSGRPDFVAHVYEEDYREIQKLVQQYPEIETGGDLFGLWQDESTVVIQLFIGPGKNCDRTTTSFHQDIDYLKKVGSVITNEDGLCNVGEWHSHHQMGVPEPSAGDCITVFSNIPQLGLERFMLFIASIESNLAKRKSQEKSIDVELHDIVLRPFLFFGSEEIYTEGHIEIIRGKNPHIESSRARSEIEKGAAEPPVEYLRGKKADKKKHEKKEHQVPEFSRATKPNTNKGKAGGGKESSARFYDNFHGRVSNDGNRSPNRSQAASQEGSNYGKTGSRQGVQGDRDRTQGNTQHETRTVLHTTQGQVSTPIDALTGKGFF